MAKEQLKTSARLITIASIALSGCRATPTPRTPEAELPTTVPSETLTPPPTKTSTPKPSPSFTPRLSPTPIPSRTEILPTPTPDYYAIDTNNEKLLNEARGGEDIDLTLPNITSIWKFPWEGEEGESKDAIIAFVWGEDIASGMVTSADCLFEHYRETDSLGNRIWPFPEIWRPEKRFENLGAEVSNIPSPIRLIDAQDITISQEGEAIIKNCEEVKALDRLQGFLGKIDWNSLPEILGGASGGSLGKFIDSFLEAYREARQ